MNGHFNKYIYGLIGICILFAICFLFIKLLPVLIVVALIVYGVSKFKSYKALKNAEKQKKSSYTSYSGNDNSTAYDADISTNPDDYTNGEVIDVDYEDVDKK